MSAEKSEVKDLANIEFTYVETMALRQIVNYAKLHARNTNNRVWALYCEKYEDLLDAKIKELVNNA